MLSQNTHIYNYIASEMNKNDIRIQSQVPKNRNFTHQCDDTVPRIKIVCIWRMGAYAYYDRTLINEFVCLVCSLRL